MKKNDTIFNESEKTNKLSSFPLSKLFPNIVTIIGLCVGLFALKEALVGNWEKAVIFIIIAGFIDGMDGRLARLLNATSNFGAQLDSLVDFVSFSVVPALTLYLWRTHEIKGLGWAVALFFIVCGAIRLARFNSSIKEEVSDKKANSYFVGIPVTMAAPLSVAPMMIDFLMNQRMDTKLFEISAGAQIIYMSIIALLMVCRIPTISLKNLKIKAEYTSLILAAAAILIIAMIVEPWITFPAIGVIYLSSIPFTCWHYCSKNNKDGDLK